LQNCQKIALCAKRWRRAARALGNTYKAVTKKLMRQQIVEEKVRVDGRKLDQVRPLSCRVGLLPSRVHGSGLFQRGLTQVLSIVTLAPQGMPR
jgi:polyribonucleotide nucleotidyltransferase